MNAAGRLIGLLVLVVPPVDATAQQQLKQPPATSSAPLKWIKSGDFDIKRGDVIEITNERKVLRLESAAPNRQRQPSVTLSINGLQVRDVSEGARVSVTGARVLPSYRTRANSPRNGGDGPTRYGRGGRGGDTECTMQLLRIAEPAGSPPVATFRLSC